MNITDKHSNECPFCEKHEEVSFGSDECHLQLDEDGLANCYVNGLFRGAFEFPKCPLCGKDIH